MDASLQGPTTYNFLGNEVYYNKFMYIPYTMVDRNNLLVSMYKHPKMKRMSVDIVRVACDLAYFPLGRAHTLEFNPMYLYAERTGLDKQADLETAPLEL